MGAGSFLKCKTSGVTEGIAFKIYTGEGCVCSGVITLDSLVFGNGICTFGGTRLVEIGRCKCIAHELYEYSNDMALVVLTVKFWAQKRKGKKDYVGRGNSPYIN
eukprot:79092-Pelagomonas_calceolata.AAC.1